MTEKPHILNYIPIPTGKPRQKFNFLNPFVILLLSVIFLLTVWPGLPALNQTGPQTVKPQHRCASHLRAIDMAIVQYLKENPNSTVPSLKELSQNNGEISPNDLICLSVKHSTSDPNPIDYVLLAEGKTRDWFTDETRVVAYEKLGHHKYSPVLYADSHVDQLDDVQLKKLIAELNAGHNPPYKRP